MVRFFGKNILNISESRAKKASNYTPFKDDSQNYNALISSITSPVAEIEEMEALKIPAFSNALEIISSAVAQLPFYLYQGMPNGDIVKIEDDKRTFLINKEPNEMMSGIMLKKRMIRDYLLYGASYNKIERNLNEVDAIYNLPIKKVTISKYVQDGYKYYAEISLIDGSTEMSKFDPSEVLIILKDTDDGYTSKGVLHTHAEILSMALDESYFTSNILKNGALPMGVLQAASRLSAPAIERLRDSFTRSYSGSRNSGKTIILEEGLEYKPISLKPNEIELTNVKKSILSDIARMFNIPESLINSSANKYNSNEQNSIHLLQYCLAPIIVGVESSLNKSLLLEEEKSEGYFWKADTSEIIRTTEKEKIEAVAKSVGSGLISFNEGRSVLDKPALDQDFFAWSLGQVFYDYKEKKLIVPNMGQTVDMSDLTKSLKVVDEDDKSEEGDDPDENGV